MCRNCCCHEPETHHKYAHHMDFLFPFMDVEEEIKMLEEYKETLTRQLEKVNKRLEALKR